MFGSVWTWTPPPPHTHSLTHKKGKKKDWKKEGVKVFLVSLELFVLREVWAGDENGYVLFYLEFNKNMYGESWIHLVLVFFFLIFFSCLYNWNLEENFTREKLNFWVFFPLFSFISLVLFLWFWCWLNVWSSQFFRLGKFELEIRTISFCSTWNWSHLSPPPSQKTINWKKGRGESWIWSFFFSFILLVLFLSSLFSFFNFFLWFWKFILKFGFIWLRGVWAEDEKGDVLFYLEEKCRRWKLILELFFPPFVLLVLFLDKFCEFGAGWRFIFLVYV